MSSDAALSTTSSGTLEPLLQPMQLGIRVYQVLVNNIVNGSVASGIQMRPEAIARQLHVSLTPVREALHRLEKDGLTVKRPYQGWFVREFTEEQIRELYILRASLERLSVRLACQRLSPENVKWMRKHQSIGDAALKSNDMDAYRLYNRDFHLAILRIAHNSYLSAAMDQVALQSEMLSAKTIHIIGRPLRGIEEHKELLELMAGHQVHKAEKLIDSHIMSALEDILSSHPPSSEHTPLLRGDSPPEIASESDSPSLQKRKKRVLRKSALD
jgi:DNA-binding GntR family transcriptional regulator